MRRSVALLTSVIVACQGATAPNIAAEGPPDFRGVITFLTDHGRFRVDDGSATACGFSDVRVPESAEIRWRVGGRAPRTALRVGRHIAVWQPEAQRAVLSARCHAIDAHLVVIENVGL